MLFLVIVFAIQMGKFDKIMILTTFFVGFAL